MRVLILTFVVSQILLVGMPGARACEAQKSQTDCNGTMQSVSDGKPCVSSIDGVLYQRDAKELVAVPRDWQGDTLVVAEGTESIGSQAVAFCRNLERVVLPEGLLEIGHRAF